MSRPPKKVIEKSFSHKKSFHRSPFEEAASSLVDAFLAESGSYSRSLYFLIQ
jgi:hypothetical protein